MIKRVHKTIILFVVLSLFATFTKAFEKPSDSLLRVLRSEIARKKVYDSQKEKHIAGLRQKLQAHEPLENRYRAALGLFEAYRDYRFDSTFHYAKQLIELSLRMHDSRRLAENQLRFGTTLITSGMFKETFDCLREIDVRLLDAELRKSYYVLYSWAWSDLSKYNADRFYAPEDRLKKFLYLDSAILLTEQGSFEQLILQAQRNPGEGSHPSKYYLQLMNRKLSEHEEAMVATGLSRYRTGEEKIRLLCTAAINDVRTSTYRAQAMLDLGNALFEQGNVNEAYYFLQQAMDQANKFGARMQRYQVSRLLPVVAAKRDLLVRQEKAKFRTILVTIVVLAVITGLICVIIFVQLKQVRAKEQVIREKNKLLAVKNMELWEAGRIKEEYIGFFFTELSRHIVKIQKLKHNVQHRVKSGSTDQLMRQLDKEDVNGDRRALFHTFDQIFLKLFPDFVEVVNSMLAEADQLKLKAGNTMSTQLRILALMRLGINDNEKLAAILEYTVSTVYTYRFRLKSKALVPAEDFEQRVMGIQITAEAV